MVTAPVPPELRRGPFTVSTGLTHTSAKALRGPGYRRLRRGVYIAADEPDSYGWEVQAVMLDLAGKGGVAAGPSAAWSVDETAFAEAGDPVHVYVPRAVALRPQAGCVMHRAAVAGRSVVRTPLGPATEPIRTAVDLARGIGTSHLTARRRLALVERLLRVTSATADDVRRDADDLRGLHGLPQARRLLSWARDGVDSLMETELRLAVVGAGLIEPIVQCPVPDARRVVARLDLGWPDLRVGVEYDGAVHRERRQHSRDLARHNAFRALEWTVFQVDARLLVRPQDWLHDLSRLVPSAPAHVIREFGCVFAPGRS